MTSRLGRGRAAEILAGGAGRRIVVVGDVFLDRYLVGQAERLSREAAVPVLALRTSFDRAGGAANPASNLAALGASVHQVGVIGDDDTGRVLAEMLRRDGIAADALVVDPDRPTTVKTRIVAEGLATPQQVARIDLQVRADVGGAIEDALVAAIEGAARGADAILVSHYRSGVVTARVAAAARQVALGSGARLTVDAQGDLDRFVGYDVVRIGRQDAARSVPAALADEADYARTLADLRRRLGAGTVILGRGADGMSVRDDRGYVAVRPANRSEVFDVAGAGDTVIAVVTLALVAGSTVREAVALANMAAGVVVRRLGVVTPTVEDILAEWRGRRCPGVADPKLGRGRR